MNGRAGGADSVGAALLRIALGVGWILEAALCDLQLQNNPSQTIRIIAVVGLIVPALAWVRWVNRRLGRLDEMLGRIEVQALVWGAVSAMLLEVATHAMFRWLDQAPPPGFIVIVPPLAFVLSQIHALVSRWSMGRAEP